MAATDDKKKTYSENGHHPKTANDKEKKPKSIYDKANILSRIFCWHVFPFLYHNYKKEFDLDAIDVVAQNDECDRLGNRLRKHWDKEVARQKAGKSASLGRAMFKSFGPQFLYTNVYNVLVYGILRMVMPMILGRIIFYSNRYFEEEINETVNSFNGTLLVFSSSIQTSRANSTDLLFDWFNVQLNNRQYVIFFSALLALVIFVNVCISHPYFFFQFRYGMNVRVALTRLVFEKALRVTNNTVQRITIGKIVNLISNDANRFDIAYIYVGFVYCAFLETAVGLFFMYQYVGWSSLGTLALVIGYIPFQTIMANVLSRFRSKSITLTDDRLRLMSEILPAMQVIKMYVWEIPFSQLVHIARKLEITKIRHSMILRSINLALYFVAPKVMSFVCLIIFLLSGGQLNAEIVFVSMALVAQIRDVITYLFPSGIAYGVEAYISIQRIEKFLFEEEISDYYKALPAPTGDYQNSSPSSRDSGKELKISLNKVTVNSEFEGVSILKDISFDVVPGKLTVIIGPVGSGKSSILLSILNEMPVSSGGTVEVNGKLIYASQEAWIFNGSIRENILFGRPFDPVLYREVIRVAALTKDLQQFDEGDQTMVDDRGTSLSGGQRARISLARALYTDADCYLLDDPLSAVDASVAKHIFEKCIKEYLHHKCVILVTHQLQFVKQAEQIVVLKDGACFACGSYMELLNRGIDIFKYAAIEQEKSEAVATSPEPSMHLMNPAQGLIRFRVDSFASEVFRSSRTSSFIESDYDGMSIHEQVNILEYMNGPLNAVGDGIGPDGDGHRQVHSMETGEQSSSNKLKIYLIYFKAGAGLLLFSTFFFSNLICQGLFTGSDWWLSVWTDYQEKIQISGSNVNFTFDRSPVISSDENTNIYIYSALVGLLFVMSIVRTVSYFVICMRSSVNLHNRVFSSLIQAPIVFFNRTPVGIIMNRVSRDLGIIDDLLPPTAFEAIEIMGNSLGIFLLCTALNYFVVIPFIFLMAMIYFASRFYINTARRLKRLEGIARSPLFNQMASALTGLPTIRSYAVEEMLVNRFSDTQDRHTATYFTFISASRVYGIFLELICVAYIYCLMVAMNINLDAYTGSIIGLTISQSLQLTNSFNWGIRQYTEVETFMTSVERINEFGQLEKEELTKAQQEPEESWPPRGDIEYEDVSLVYNVPNSNETDEPTKAVLKNLTFDITGGEKIGIVGRTGAGKSSLITTLFRLTQPSGRILIDGIDTADISLSRLRRCLSIIPQEPVLFSGNIRRNLDPFNEKTDEELWDAIDKVQLKAKILSFPSKLDSPVSESGSDFSVGQKQLICLARAILRKNRIIICDEATANVDPRTDSLIQNTIRTEFAHCTVITIAHRLNTIIDNDRVMVLDAGELSQFDSPYALIKKKSGIFYELYDNLNPDTKAELKRMAQKAYADRQKTQM